MLSCVLLHQVLHNVFPELLRDDLTMIVKWARCATALQPDGSKVPATRCTAIHQEISEYVQVTTDAAWAAPAVTSAACGVAVPLTFGQRVQQLVEEKLLLLREPLPGRPSDFGSMHSGEWQPLTVAQHCCLQVRCLASNCTTPPSLKLGLLRTS